MDKESPSLIASEDLVLSHDDYFREAFQTKRLAKAFLRKKLPKETLAHLDLKKLIVERRHMTDDLFKDTIADVVYRVPIEGSKEHVNFFVVIEHIISGLSDDFGVTFSEFVIGNPLRRRNGARSTWIIGCRR